MWKKSLGTMFGQKEWKTHKENAQVKMGGLWYFFNECVTAPWYFVMHTQSEVISTPLSQ